MRSRFARTRFTTAAGVLLTLAACGTPTFAVDFDRDVLPILADKCFKCHGPDPEAREGGLRLDVADVSQFVGDSGEPVVVVGQPDESELVRRIRSDDASERMPPADSNLELTVAEQMRLVEWVADGATISRHWAFEPIERPEVPVVDGPSRNPIDAFILQRLDGSGLAASVRAERHRLIRRVSLDLLGVPPTLAEADAFLADESPGAYRRVVDRLLASPAFGERLAWNWLDAARYADTNGYQGDRERTMWPWRDWVIDALNRDLSYDQFTIWQLAGDLLPEASFESRLATGFARNHMINGEGGRIPEENRVDYVMDMAETTGTVWLGLTLNCCRCHDHKFDPLSRQDYYSFFAFFNQTPVTGGGGDPSTAPILRVPDDQQTARMMEADLTIQETRKHIAAWEAATFVEPAASQQEGEREPPKEIADLLAKPVERRDDSQLEQLAGHFREQAPEYATALDKLRELNKNRQRIESAVPRVMIMEELPEPRPTFMLDKGLYNKPEGEVPIAVPARFTSLRESAPKNRLGLARWLVDDDNPLTARITVNRIWQQFFGQGLVATAEDFGTQGERPSHPELLDWLAAEFRESGWDVKQLCRLIVTSSTYQQSSRVTADQYELDPDNRLLRGPRFRMPAWMIRDQALAVSGLLDDQVGGPPVNPYQPGGVWEDATFGKKKYEQDHGAKLYRRSIYTFWRRIIAPTMFFDSASRQTCTVKMSRTNTPLQALTVMNDVTFIEAARVLATDILRQSPTASDAELVRLAVRRVLIRPPTEEESRLLVATQRRLAHQFSVDPTSAEQLVNSGEYPAPDGVDIVRAAAMTGVCSLLLNLDEAITKE